MTDSPVAIGDIVRNGIVFDFKNWEHHLMSEAEPRTTVARLFSLLDERGVDYVPVAPVWAAAEE